MLVRLGTALLATVLVAAPFAVAAQETRKLPRIGFLTVAPRSSPYLQMFEDGLRELGHVVGETVIVEIRSADQNPERLPALATELMHRQNVDVMVVPARGRHNIEAVPQASRTTPPHRRDLG